jgi:hypothetical protein
MDFSSYFFGEKLEMTPADSSERAPSCRPTTTLFTFCEIRAEPESALTAHNSRAATLYRQPHLAASAGSAGEFVTWLAGPVRKRIAE